MKDYRLSHQEKRIVEQYEEKVYSPFSYDSFLWRWEKKILSRLLEKLRKQKDTIDYLDFACGTGRIIGFLESKASGAVGVDNSEGMLRIARQKTKNCRLVCADLTKDDVLRGEKFDLISAFRFFLNAQPELREETMKILPHKLKDGQSIFVFNVHGNLWSHRLLTKIYFWLRGRRLNTLSYWQMKKLIKQHNLKIVRCYGFGSLPKIFYRFFSHGLMFKIDSFFSHCPLAKYFSYNLIFTCSLA